MSHASTQSDTREASRTLASGTKAPAPIPVPLSVRLDQIRRRFVPPVVFAVAVATATVLWLRVAPQATFAGLGEGRRSIVTAPQPAVLKELLVEPYTIVEEGTPIAVITPMDVRADFDLLRSYFDLARVQAQPSLAEENALDFERLRVELLRTQAKLAVAEVKLQQAERDVARNTPLYHERLVSEDIYELSVNIRDALKTEVAEKQRAVEAIQRRLDELRDIGEPQLAGSNDLARELLQRLEEAQATVASNLGPITLTAPISGMVTTPLRQPGEYLVEGEPLLYINSLRAERIVGYLRQPYYVDPEPGMSVRVTTRTHERSEFDSYILQVGAQVEVITNALAFLRTDVLYDAGLPIIVHVPDSVHVRPGEVVDITIRSPRRGPSPPEGPSAELDPALSPSGL